MFTLRLGHKRTPQFLFRESKSLSHPQASILKPIWTNQLSYYHVTLSHNNWNMIPYGYDDGNSLIWKDYAGSVLDFLQNGIFYGHRKGEGRRSWRKYFRKQGFLARVRTIAGRKIIRRQRQNGRHVIGRPKN